MSEEHVLCVTNNVVNSAIGRDGFVPFSTVPEFLLDPTNLWFLPRRVAETSESFRQVIPYVILRSADRLLVYRRARAGRESRLHRRMSLGFGGHVGLQDVVMSDQLDFEATVTKATDRELREEIEGSMRISRRPIGVIIDNSEPVSRVHLGLAEVWEVKVDTLTSIDPAVEMCAFWHMSELLDGISCLESWSRLCLEGWLMPNAATGSDASRTATEP